MTQWPSLRFTSGHFLIPPWEPSLVMWNCGGLSRLCVLCLRSIASLSWLRPNLGDAPQNEQQGRQTTRFQWSSVGHTGVLVAQTASKTPQGRATKAQTRTPQGQERTGLPFGVEFVGSVRSDLFAVNASPTFKRALWVLREPHVQKRSSKEWPA